jgi:RNA-binding protein YhbY
VRPSIKDRLEEEKELVKVEAEKIAEGYSADVFRVVMNKNNAELCEAP